MLHGIIIQSGNDASVALAEHTAGDEAQFAELMNLYAAELGMTGSHFQNSTGLPQEAHYSTPRDLFILSRALINRFPDLYKLHSIKSFTYGEDFRTGEPIKQYNRNKLLWSDPAVDGIKTGHTVLAGYCLVASAKKNDTRLISVVAGTESEKKRIQETRKLLNYGFRFFESINFLKKNQVIEPGPKVWGGAKDSIPIWLNEDVWLTIPKGSKEALVTRVSYPDAQWAPVKEGQAVGRLEIVLGENIIKTVPIVARDEVVEGTFFGKMLDRLLVMFD